MCGIHGFIDKKLTAEQRNLTIQKMVNATLHRGPDSSHFECFDATALGHNRLSIIDLSEGGKQPFTIDEFTIVFNGEIYNYKEIREELKTLGYSFHSDSDTEVLLRAYIHWGKAAISKFLGMWAFAIWNNKTKQLLCSRDRFGIKPFYYINEGGRFYFASEVKSLKASPVFSNDINIDQLSRSLQMGWIGYGEETTYAKVKQLEPGTLLHIDGEQLQFERYWNYPTIAENLTDDALFAKYEELFLDSLKMHLRSDVQLGATLSGGIDSSSIVTSIIEAFGIHDLKTFSIFYEGENSVDERPFIQEIEKKYAGKFHANYYSPDVSSVADEFDRIAYHCDFPLLGSSPISQYFIMKEISKQGIKVILSGQGADDYLGGYMHSYYRFYAEMFQKLRWLRGLKEMGRQKKYQQLNNSDMMKVLMKAGLSVLFSETKLYQLEYSKYYPNLFNTDSKNTIQLKNPGYGKMNNFHYHLMKTTSLPTLLHYEDRNSMAFSIESRVPFLDHRLVELGITSNADTKIRNGYTKAILREAMVKYLPEAIYKRTDKKGFVTPGEVKWLRGDLSHLLDIDFNRIPNLNKSLVNSELEKFRKGDNSNASLIWRLASINHWVKTN